MLAFRHLAAGLAALTFLACKSDVEPLAPPAPAAPDLSLRHPINLDPSSAIGAGVFLLGGTVPTNFAFFSAQLHATGPAAGYLSFYTQDEGFVYDIQGRVTCMAVDEVNHRAWIGGVVTRNKTTDPAFQTPIHQVGQDLWFRMVDRGEGPDAGDRMTFVGFKGAAGVQTSPEYCERKLWLNEGQPITQGGVLVRP